MEWCTVTRWFLPIAKADGSSEGTASGFVPVNSVSRSHTHTTSTTGGVFDNGLAIVQVPGVGACSYTLNPTGSTFTINADGSGTSTVNWTAVATNPVKCGPSFTSHAASISGANGTVAVGSDTNGSFVSKCDSQ